MKNSGKLIWITGLSGAGKTTIAKKVYDIVIKQDKNTMHLDGDELRIVFNQFTAYNSTDREKTAETYARLCRFLTARGINVIISTISLFHSVQEYNRKNNHYYYEILLDVDKSVLMARNKGGLYDPGNKNVMGMDLQPEFPEKPNLVLKNNVKNNINDNALKIIRLIMGVENEHRMN